MINFLERIQRYKEILKIFENGDVAFCRKITRE